MVRWCFRNVCSCLWRQICRIAAAFMPHSSCACLFGLVTPIFDPKTDRFSFFSKIEIDQWSIKKKNQKLIFRWSIKNRLFDDWSKIDNSKYNIYFKFWQKVYLSIFSLVFYFWNWKSFFWLKKKKQSHQNFTKFYRNFSIIFLKNFQQRVVNFLKFLKTFSKFALNFLNNFREIL